jgi:hypothetical protein
MESQHTWIIIVDDNLNTYLHYYYQLMHVIVCKVCHWEIIRLSIFYSQYLTTLNFCFHFNVENCQRYSLTYGRVRIQTSTQIRKKYRVWLRGKTVVNAIVWKQETIEKWQWLAEDLKKNRTVFYT